MAPIRQTRRWLRWAAKKNDKNSSTSTAVGAPPCDLDEITLKDERVPKPIHLACGLDYFAIEWILTNPYMRQDAFSALRMTEDFERVEQEIVRLRTQLSDLSRKRYSAETSGNEGKVFDARINLADSALRNCSAVCDYIRRVSKSIAREIDAKNEKVTRSLDAIKKTRNLGALHAWYTEELAPFWNKVEQEWDIIAEMREKEKTPSRVDKTRHSL